MGSKKPFNNQVRIRAYGNYDSLFVTDAGTTKAKIEKLSKKLSKLDKEIVEKQKEYESILIAKAKLIDQLEKENARNQNKE